MKNEVTSKKVASGAAKALRGPTQRDSDDCYDRWLALPIPQRDGHWLFAMRYWHRRVKAALASALTQAADKQPAKKKGRRRHQAQPAKR